MLHVMGMIVPYLRQKTKLIWKWNNMFDSYGVMLILKSNNDRNQKKLHTNIWLYYHSFLLNTFKRNDALKHRLLK